MLGIANHPHILNIAMLFKLALNKGYKNIEITILPSPMIEEIRNYSKDYDASVYIFVAHTTKTAPG